MADELEFMLHAIVLLHLVVTSNMLGVEAKHAAKALGLTSRRGRDAGGGCCPSWKTLVIGGRQPLLGPSQTLVQSRACVGRSLSEPGPCFHCLIGKALL